MTANLTCPARIVVLPAHNVVVWGGRAVMRSNVVPSLAVFSGGTAMNMLCRSLQGITDDIVYIMPISGTTGRAISAVVGPMSLPAHRLTVPRADAWTGGAAAPDNGGSTSEIVRVLGGPAIGDIRSRMVRLADDSTAEAKALSELLQYRLPLSGDDAVIRAEWFQLIDGSHRCRTARDSCALARALTHTASATLRGKGGGGDRAVRLQALDGNQRAVPRDHPRCGIGGGARPSVVRSAHERVHAGPACSACGVVRLRQPSCCISTPACSRVRASLTLRTGAWATFSSPVSIPGVPLSRPSRLVAQSHRRPPRKGRDPRGRAGARLLFGSLEAAIFLFSGIARIPRRTEVIPIINLKFEGITIGAVLTNGELIIGQNEISHPAPPLPTPVDGAGAVRGPRSGTGALHTAPATRANRAHLPTPRPSRALDVGRALDAEEVGGRRQSPKNRNIIVDKSSSLLDLGAPISKVFYVNSDGNGTRARHEISHSANVHALMLRWRASAGWAHTRTHAHTHTRQKSSRSSTSASWRRWRGSAPSSTRAALFTLASCPV